MDKATFLRAKISIDDIPRELHLFRALAERNDPHSLEEKDIQDFISMMDENNREFAIRQFKTCFRFLKPTDKNLLAISVITLSIMSAVRGLETKFEDSDRQQLARFFKDSARPADSLIADINREVKELTVRVSPFYDDSYNMLTRRVRYDSVKFGSNQEFKQRLMELDANFDLWFEGFNKRFGINVSLPDPPRGIAVVRDGYIERKSKAQFDNVSGTIFLSSEAIMLNNEVSQKHEANHMWLCAAIGEATYINLPRWFKEGLAIYATDDMESRKIDLLADGYPHPAARLLDYNSNNYYEMSVAVKYLIDNYGKLSGKKDGSFITDLIGKIREGHSFNNAMKQLIPTWNQLKVKLPLIVYNKIIKDDLQPESLEKYLSSVESAYPSVKADYFDLSNNKRLYATAREKLREVRDWSKSQNLISRWKQLLNDPTFNNSNYARMVRFLLMMDAAVIEGGERDALECAEQIIRESKSTDQIYEYALFVRALHAPASSDNERAERLRALQPMLTNPAELQYLNYWHKELTGYPLP